MKKTLLFEAAGTIESPVERVEVLDARGAPGRSVGPDNAWLMSRTGGTIEGGPERFTLRRAGYAMTVEVVGQTFAMQGGWWYPGGVHRRAAPRGNASTHRVFNVASRGRWGVPLANRFFVGFAKNSRDGFAAAIELQGARLLDAFALIAVPCPRGRGSGEPGVETDRPVPRDVRIWPPSPVSPAGTVSGRRAPSTPGESPARPARSGSGAAGRSLLGRDVETARVLPRGRLGKVEMTSFPGT